jgi:hypothetical protein
MSGGESTPGNDAARDDGWESWRVWFSLHLFTTLQGMAAPVWARHLWRNRFLVEPRFWPRALLISISSPVNSLFAARDQRKFGPAIAKTKIEPPLFLLGHWRSGTTLLQRLFGMDDRFSFPNFYQCTFPRGFLHSEKTNAQRWANMLPRTRIFDQMDNRFDSPAEDEFALCSLTGLSPYMGWSFPRHWDDYDRYLTLRDVPRGELDAWREAMTFFVQKIQYHTGRRVVLKSPTHTCRIKILQDLFPGAKFVHIHRNPYAIFPSTKKMLTTFLQSTQLQSFDPAGLDERILRTYQTMYDVHFEERDLVPKDDFCEVGYEELEADPLGEMCRLYESLGLPSFDHVRPGIEAYVASQKGYQKNQFRALDEELCRRIARDWARSLEEWHYESPRSRSAGVAS